MVSRRGVEYEYALVNVNEVLVPRELEEIRRKQAFVENEALQERLGGALAANGVEGGGPVSAWQQNPPGQGYVRSLSVCGEIVSV